jgi:hypothetical protein
MCHEKGAVEEEKKSYGSEDLKGKLSKVQRCDFQLLSDWIGIFIL